MSMTQASLEAMPYRDRYLALVDGADPELLESYFKWINTNPHVIDEFIANAKAMQATGRTKYSGWIIVNKMRWDYELRTQGSEFGIPNDYIALLVRHAIARHPDLFGFFELREMGKRQPAAQT